MDKKKQAAAKKMRTLKLLRTSGNPRNPRNIIKKDINKRRRKEHNERKDKLRTMPVPKKSPYKRRKGVA